MSENFISKLKEMISKKKKVAGELNSLAEHSQNAKSMEEKKMVDSHAKKLKDSLKKTNEEFGETLHKISLTKPLMAKTKSSTSKLSNDFPNKEKKDSKISSIKKEKTMPKKTSRRISDYSKLSLIEKETLKRLKKKGEEIVKKKKTKKPSKYIKTANKFFSDTSRKLLKKKIFAPIKKDLIKTNLEFTPTSYISVILFTTVLAVVGSFFLFIILLLGGLGFLSIFWILFVIPVATFIFMYFYPSLERKSAEYNIDQELPFATIHMSSISGSELEPSKIFSIIIATKEYPHIEKEFIKLINEINIYGYDLVTAMRSVALKTPSKKLAELLNSLATTINSGGELPIFFNKRAQSLLFDYRLEREKYTKTAETFMDIYISVVIAAPMILMLLLMMMRISGLGISLSGSMITLIMVLGVSLVNVVFLVFLHLKQPKG